MRYAITVIGSILLMTLMQAHAQTTAFDGAWNVTLTCPPHNDNEGTKGYTHVFPAEVKNGQLKGIFGEEGVPGWQFLHGEITPEGNAILTLDGIVNNSEYAIGKSPKGKRFTYKVRAEFAQSSGTGQRLSGRVCEFRFAR